MIWAIVMYVVLLVVVSLAAHYVAKNRKGYPLKDVENRLIKLPGYSQAMTPEQILAILEKNEGPSPLSLSAFNDWAIVRAVQPLTPVTPKAQDTPKRYSGPQLRRIQDRLNAEYFVQERPNSEVLQEQENG